MSEFVLTPAERDFLAALNELDVRYMLVGMGAAILEGADGATQDLDVWLGQIDGEKLQEAARRAGGFYTVGFGLHPPTLGGAGLDRLDIVLTAQGLNSFDDEYAKAVEIEIDGFRLKLLSLDRVIASKRAANRIKDLAQLPALEAALAAREEAGLR